MGQFKQIIILRNQGYTQEEIASQLCISRRSVIRYLKTGEIPVYTRTKPSKIDLVTDYLPEIERILSQDKKIMLEDLYAHLSTIGYSGSLRTLRRGTVGLRRKLKNKSTSIYFQRETIAGDVMEGDFTEVFVPIGGIQREIHLWVVSLPHSNKVWATPFYYENFECFAQGSINAFEAFGGIATKYRLDNLKPAVSKILSGHDREVTQRFKKFQQHYDFKQDFCNPNSGNEKGNVECNNKHFKKALLSRLAIFKIAFVNLEAFSQFVWDFCKERNGRSHIIEEQLSPLPYCKFDAYRTEIVVVNKFSLFTIDKHANYYSAPSELVGLHLEARVYPDKVVLLDQGKIVTEHARLYAKRGNASILVEHIIEALNRKPNAMKDWRYRSILFERPIWEKFYKAIRENKQDHEYLKCLLLMKKYQKENLTAAMELVLQENLPAKKESLEEILETKRINILEMQSININLAKYDEVFLNTGETNEFTNQS